MKGAAALLVAFALGLAGGLVYAWAINPVSYTDTSPASLRGDFRADYLTLIAVAYDATGYIKSAITDVERTLGGLARDQDLSSYIL